MSKQAAAGGSPAIRTRSTRRAATTAGDAGARVSHYALAFGALASLERAQVVGNVDVLFPRGEPGPDPSELGAGRGGPFHAQGVLVPC